MSESTTTTTTTNTSAQETNTNEQTGLHFSDLTAFQRDLLWTLDHEGGRKGLALLDELEDYYDEDLNHGRLYPNLQKLEEQGWIDVGARDRRTNEYRLTDAAKGAIDARQQWQAGGDQ